MTSTIVTYQMISNNMLRSLQQTAEKPDVSRDTDYFLKNIGKAKTIDDFLGDYRLYSYAMKAYGLSDMTYAKAFMRKVLTEGISSKNAFANKLVDRRYRDFAAAFNFAALGDHATNTTAATTGTANKYVRQALEEDAGSKSEGVRLALYFERKASTITSPYQILSDKALIQVVQTALGISSMTSMADVDKQAAMLSKRIDFADFKDPAKLKTFLQRFSAMWDVQNSDAASTSPALAIITGGQSRDMGLNADILTSLQNLKFGR